MPQQFTTPVGRIVWGNPMRPQPVIDKTTKLQKLDKNNKPRVRYSFGVAYPRAQFDQYVRPWLEQEARAVYPQGVPRDFAWKITDGDNDVDPENKPYRDREGYAGHYVLAFSTEGYCPPCVTINEQKNGYRDLTEKEISAGFYVVVKMNCQFNQSTDSPGLYINPEMVNLVGYGSVIMSRSAVDPMEAFGAQQYQLPPGASMTPLAPAIGNGVTAGGAPAPAQYAQHPAPQPYPLQQPVQVQYAPAPQAAPVQQHYQPAPVAPVPQQYAPPAHDFVQNAGQPQQYAPQQPAAPVMGNGAPPAVAPAPAQYAPAPQQYATTATQYPSNQPPQGYPQR